MAALFNVVSGEYIPRCSTVTTLRDKCGKPDLQLTKPMPARVDDWLINPDLSQVGGVEQRFWRVKRDKIVPATEKEMLPILIKEKVRQISEQAFAFVEDHYDQRKRDLIQLALADANANNKAAKAKYLSQSTAWLNEVRAFVTSFIGVVQQAKTVSEVATATLDLSSFDATDPKVSLVKAESM